MTSARQAQRDAVTELAAHEVPSPSVDAAVLLAHVLQCTRSELITAEAVTDEQLEVYRSLVTRRAAREPLQHLTGVAPFRHVELAVGPGVFVPRPETELLAGWAIEQARAVADTTGRVPVVIDLCTGSGAIARSLIDEGPETYLHAVEVDPGAHAWAQRNLEGTGVELHLADAVGACAELMGTVDVITCNPPYIPHEAWESVVPEARDHDPHLALFADDDGLAVVRGVVAHAARLLRPGGVIGIEHSDAQGEAMLEVFAAAENWETVRDHLDLAERPRFTTARLAR